MRWNEFWEMLPERKLIGNDWKPPPPLILAAWSESTTSDKRKRLQEHLPYADKNEFIDKAGQFLRDLPKNQWFYENE